VLQGPRENLHHPAIDPLFRPAAAYGQRVIGVILTGMFDGGTAGLMVVRTSGGEALVEDANSARFPSMPRSAMNQVPTAQGLPLQRIADSLLQLIGEEQPYQSEPTKRAVLGAAKETRIAKLDLAEV
jgi:two-component system chemotaxis response regulator CheB